MDDKKSILVEKIKAAVIELVHYTEDQIKTNLSDYLSEKLNYDYTYLANLKRLPDLPHRTLKN